MELDVTTHLFIGFLYYREKSKKFQIKHSLNRSEIKFSALTFPPYSKFTAKTFLSQIFYNYL